MLTDSAPATDDLPDDPSGVDRLVAAGFKLPAKPRYEDIEGAPFKIGDAVEVVTTLDDTLDEAWIGKRGVVEYFEYDCGCSQTFPTDPMIGVRFPDRALEEFWQEELALLPPANGDLIISTQEST